MRYVNNFYLFSDEISQSLKKSIDAFDDHSELVYKRWFSLFSEEEHKKINLRINNFFSIQEIIDIEKMNSYYKIKEFLKQFFFIVNYFGF